MGKRKCIGNDNGSTQYSIEFCHTTDGETWHDMLFELLDDAREYASRVLRENEGNPEFRCFARRIVLVSTADFFDNSICAVNLRVIDRHADI